MTFLISAISLTVAFILALIMMILAFAAHGVYHDVLVPVCWITGTLATIGIFTGARDFY